MHKEGLELVFESAKDGILTAKRNGLYLHSKYRPFKEAEEFCSKFILEDEETYINIYGLALGYHIEPFLKRYKRIKLNIFELDDELFNEAKKRGCYKELLENPRVRLFIGSRDVFSNISSYIKETGIEVYKPSLRSVEDLYKDFFNSIEIFERIKFDLENNKKILMENERFNESIEHKNMDEFYSDVNFKGEDVILVSSGISLDDKIEVIKEKRNNFKIISVGSAARTLVNNGILPDCLVIIDMKPVVEKQLMGFENLGIPLCFLSTASRWATRSYKGPKYIFYNDERGGRCQIATGKTVAVAALNIAIKWKPRRIIFVGQDLAYIGDKTHTRGTEESYGYRLTVKESSNMKKTIGVHGKELNTSSSYLYYKRRIEMSISENRQVEFINCSDGANIEGAIKKNIKEI